jgi:F-type H+-transporting ATPase subunit a
MTHSPLEMAPVLRLGPVPITDPVIVTWALMAILVLFAAIVSRRVSLLPSKRHVTLEMLVGAVDSQIRDTMQTEPRPYRALIGTIFVFILTANWSSLIPGVEPPTAHIETDTALALIVFCATMFFGIRTRGLGGYLATFADPIWIMTPINVFEQFTRTFSLIVRLFGNIMSGVFVIGILLSLAGLLVPIPFMALDLLTGAIQAYIFTVLAMVFIGASIAEGSKEASTQPRAIS